MTDLRELLRRHDYQLPNVAIWNLRRPCRAAARLACADHTRLVSVRKITSYVYESCPQSGSSVRLRAVRCSCSRSAKLSPRNGPNSRINSKRIPHASEE